MIFFTQIIEFYLKQLEVNRNSVSLNKKEIYVYPIRFYPTLKYGQNDKNRQNSNGAYLNEKENFNLFDYNSLFIPIHKTSTDHWALAVI